MSTPPLTVAAIGFWHVHAADYARAAQRHPGTRLVALWDDDPERREAAAEDLGVEAVADLDELLARDDLDAVTITTETTKHNDVIRRAIRAGKHVFSEKLLAPTVGECDELIAAARRARVVLTVSLPRLYDDYTVAIERILDEGSLGDLTYTRVRLAHDGWAAGWLPERFGDPDAAVGGALTDLGCHPAYLTRLFHRAEPLAVSASYGSITGRRVEDNAVVAAEFPGGRLGVFEASVAATPGAFTLELRGTAASLMFGFGSERLLAKGGTFGEQWAEIALPAARPGPFEQWFQCIHDGTFPNENLRNATALTRIVTAANESAASGRRVVLPAEPGRRARAATIPEENSP